MTTMDFLTTLDALRKLLVETGSLACLGCGHEHNCSTHGCAILRNAVEHMEAALANYDNLSHLEAELRSERLLTAFSYAILEKKRVSVEKMRSRWITVVEVDGKQHSKCAACQNGLDGLEDAYSFCPHCGAPMTDEAVDMMMKRWEAMEDGKGD